MAVQSDEILNNWSNQIRKTPQGERMVAAQLAATYKARGFNERQAQNMLDAQKFSSSVVDSAIAESYHEAKEAVVASVKEVMVCPNSYREVVSCVEKCLDESTPKEFVNKLARSEEPILRISSKGYDSWVRLAEQAKADTHGLQILHTELKPWIEEAMYLSFCASQKLNGKMKLANDQTRAVYSSKKFDSNSVDLTNGTCDCEKFSKSNFKEFGLACEHMIKAAELASPMQRIRRAIGL